MDPFEALADPVRREILLLIRDEPRTAGWLAGQFPISRPAVSRHLRVLRESGLVRAELRGRERIYTLDPTADPTAFDIVADYLVRLIAPRPTRFAAALEAGLDALHTEVHRTRRDRAAAATDRPTADPAGDQESPDAATSGLPTRRSAAPDPSSPSKGRTA